MLVYISHEFGGELENVQRTEELIKDLIKKYDQVQPVSPIHATGFLYNEVSYEKGIDWCLNLLRLCDVMIVFGHESMSRGCIIEKEFCDEFNIPILDIDDFDEYYKRKIGDIDDKS